MWGKTEVEVRREWYKWRVDGRIVWEHYQEAIAEEFMGWKEARVIGEVKERCLIEEVWRRREKIDGEVRGMVVR